MNTKRGAAKKMVSTPKRIRAVFMSTADAKGVRPKDVAVEFAHGDWWVRVTDEAAYRVRGTGAATRFERVL